ncbi:MAG: DUF4870 domain-containing protein [Candidatus Riflebacteria bacterium]|nr:DUF4870 domain-containing protein [Candidatus Riflebacteria bacterium]
MANKTSLGLPENIEALTSYFVFFISGGLIFALEKENKFVKFHAMQSIIISILLIILSIILNFIPIIGWIMLFPLALGSLFLWIFLMLKAFQGEKFKLPIVGDYAEKTSES